MITIVDYGMGNIGSLENMISRVGGESCFASTPEEIQNAEKLLLPGVGSFDNAVSRLRQSGLWEVIDTKVRVDKVPILCICLGAQLATESSEEGRLEGFGWLRAKAKLFSFSDGDRRIPHMGWNDVRLMKDSILTRGLAEDPAFYFVHSYFIEALDPADVVMQTEYGLEFASGLERDNVFAFQFHPEKSHKYGMTIIRNFSELQYA